MRHVVPALMIAALVVGTAPVFQAAEAADEAPSSVENACDKGEHWRYGPSIPAEWSALHKAYLSGKRTPVAAFSDAIAMRRAARNEEARMLAEYWASRALYDGKLLHLASDGFGSIVGRPARPGTVGVQLAAVECLSAIESRYPALTSGKRPYGAAKLREFSRNAGTNQQFGAVREAAFRLLLSELAAGADRARTDELVEMVVGNPAIETAARALVSASHGEGRSASQAIEKVLSGPSLPAVLARYTDAMRLVLARVAYSSGQFDRATEQLKLVRKSSNELVSALSELAWANLAASRYSEAIGTAMNLQQGGLRHTFAPEAPMVMAMALNEICQYPESVRAIRIFRKHYEQPFRWLSDWESHPRSLYPLAVQFMKKKGDVPERVASEWVRAPGFIARQEEINLLFEERDSSRKLGKSGALEKKAVAASIRKLVADLRGRIREARAKQKSPDEALPKYVREDLAKLRDLLLDYGRLAKAAPAWRTLLAGANRRAPGIERRLVEGVNADLSARSMRMLRQLEEIAENNQLIEVEIYNGASQDIIWQNAHPDYKKVAAKLKDEKPKGSAEVWDWGRAPSGLDDSGEIWEDELGSFKANLYDNCSSKDKYLALKRKASG